MPNTRYQVQIHGDWADTTGGWRPAICGTLSQTGESDEFASTFDSREEAEQIADELRRDSAMGERADDVCVAEVSDTQKPDYWHAAFPDADTASEVHHHWTTEAYDGSPITWPEYVQAGVTRAQQLAQDFLERDAISALILERFQGWHVTQDADE